MSVRSTTGSACARLAVCRSSNEDGHWRSSGTGKFPIPSLVPIEPAVELGETILLGDRRIAVVAGIGEPPETITCADASEVGPLGLLRLPSFAYNAVMLHYLFSQT